MKEYIDKEKAIEAIRLTYCKDCNSYNGVRCRACEFDDAMMEIEDCPTADVVEVVRCKDCKNYCEYKIKGEPTGWGKCEAIAMDIDLMANDYCSYGERKEQG